MLSSLHRREQVHRVWRHRGECYAACNIIQHDQPGSESVMVWEGVSLEGHAGPHVLANSTLTSVTCQVVRPPVCAGQSPASCTRSVQAVPG